MKPKILRPIAVALSFVLFSTNVLFAHSAETNFWKERGRPVQLAALPTDIGALPSITSRTALFPREIALPAGAPSSLRSVVEALPLNAGSIRKISVPKNATGRTVIHIQDVHQNLEAQRNIEQAVQSLIDKKTISLVGLEGAFGPMGLAWVRSHPAQNSVKAVADYLFREKRIAGPMHAAFVSKAVIPSFVGIDDKTHYDANVEAVRRSAASAAAEKTNVAGQLQMLSQAKALVFNSRLKDFDAQVEAYRNGSVSWSTYVRSMSSRASSVSPALTAYLTALSSEEKLDMPQVESQRARLLEQLSRKLNPTETQNVLDHTAAYRTGELGHSDFYAFLKKLCADKGVEFSRYPAMNGYIRYVMLADSLDVDAIVNDAATLEKKLYASLATSEHERSLVADEHRLHLTEKLLSFALTKEEWQEYANSKSQISNSKFETSSFERFYEEAEIRDHKMAENLLSSMDQSHSQVAAIVTGGFHSQGLSRQLQDRGVTVITYVPKVSKIEDETGSAYLSVFTQEKTPLDKLFAGEKLFLSPLAEPRRDVMEPMVALNQQLTEALKARGELVLSSGFVLHEVRDLISGVIEEFNVTPDADLMMKLRQVVERLAVLLKRQEVTQVIAEAMLAEVLNGLVWCSLSRESVLYEQLFTRNKAWIEAELRAVIQDIQFLQQAIAVTLKKIDEVLTAEKWLRALLPPHRWAQGKTRKISSGYPHALKSVARETWGHAAAAVTSGGLTIQGRSVMEPWQKEYMGEFAKVVTQRGGRILELGFGLGLSASAIEQHDIAEHVIIEPNEDVFKRLQKFAKTAPHKVTPILGAWQNVISDKTLFPDESFDGIFFDASPFDERELHFRQFDFAKHASRLLKPGGIYTYCNLSSMGRVKDFYDQWTDLFLETQLPHLENLDFKKITFSLTKANPPEGDQKYQHDQALVPVMIKRESGKGDRRIMGIVFPLLLTALITIMSGQKLVAQEQDRPRLSPSGMMADDDFMELPRPDGLSKESFQEPTAAEIAEEHHDRLVKENVERLIEAAKKGHVSGNPMGTKQAFDRAIEESKKYINHNREMYDKRQVAVAEAELGLVDEAASNHGKRTWRPAVYHVEVLNAVREKIWRKVETTHALERYSAALKNWRKDLSFHTITLS